MQSSSQPWQGTGQGPSTGGGRWGARGRAAGHAEEGQSTGRGWAHPGQPVRALSPGLVAGAALLAGSVFGEPLVALCWGAKAEPHPQLLIQDARPPSRPESWGVDAKTQPAGCASVPQRQCRSALNRKQLLLPAHPEGLGGVFLTHYTDYYSISEVTQWGPRDSHLQKALRALITKN